MSDKAVMTNMPGPTQQLYLAGRPIRDFPKRPIRRGADLCASGDIVDTPEQLG